jgi:hypothetical protein
MSKFNQKWYNFVKRLNKNECYTFYDFIFNDGLKREITICKSYDDKWVFTINNSQYSNEGCYNSIIPTINNKKYEFRLSSPTLLQINEKMMNIKICIYHISCKDVCELEMIESPNEACPICLKDFEQHYLIITKCKHSFCLPCLNTLVEQRRKGISDEDEDWYDIPCPLCRENLSHSY